MAENNKYHFNREHINRHTSLTVSKMQRNSKVIKGLKISIPPVDIIDLYRYYKIVIPVPGFQKEDFLIKTNNCFLTIIAINKQLFKPKDGYDILNVDINLPDNVDTDFGTAECKNGMLYIYLSKTNCKTINLQSEIVVY